MIGELLYEGGKLECGEDLGFIVEEVEVSSLS